MSELGTLASYQMLSGCSGHADQNRPSPMQLAGFCSYQSDCMSLRAHIVTCHARSADLLAWCSRQTSEGAARSTARRTACTTCSREEPMTS